MFVFPNSPAVNDIANGYTWDGEKWTMAAVPDATKLNVSGGQRTTGGFKTTVPDLGPVASPFTPNPYLGNYQIINNGGPLTINPPTDTCGIDLLIYNLPTAGAVTFGAGFYVGAGKTGDALTTTSGSMFVVSIRKFTPSLATYVIKALQ